MEFDLCPAVTLQTGTFSAVVAPVETVTAAVNTNKKLQRFMFLYVCGNYSRILTNISRTAGTFEVRRAFTVHQLLTILREAYHTIILVEHDPSLFEGADEGVMLAEVIRALKTAAQEAMVILYAPAADRIFHTLAKGADRVFSLIPIDSVPARIPVRGGRRGGKIPGLRLQTTLEVFYGTNDREQPHGGQDPFRPLEACDPGVAER
jgi:DNA polymerase I